MIAEQFGQTPVKGAPSAQHSLLERFLGAAPAADVIVSGARAVTTDRLGEPGVAQQPTHLSAHRAAALRRQRPVVAGDAHRTLGPVRHRAPVATAVRTSLRLHGRAGAAQHPASALAAARTDPPTIRARDGRAGPADRAQIRVAAARRSGFRRLVRIDDPSAHRSQPVAHPLLRALITSPGRSLALRALLHDRLDQLGDAALQ